MCLCGCRLELQQESGMWHWRNGWEIHYERARRDGAPPLLLLPGFGVGTFHFKRNMQEVTDNSAIVARFHAVTSIPFVEV